MITEDQEKYLARALTKLHVELHNVFCAPDWPCEHWCQDVTQLRKKLGLGPGWYDYPDEKK